MMFKYSSRWAFYRTVGSFMGKRITEVVNPAKDSKIRVVGERSGVDVDRFVKIAKRLRWFWPLLP